MRSRVMAGLASLVFGVNLAVEALAQEPGAGTFKITETVLCRALDGENRPVTPANEFKPDVGVIYCWFAWEGAAPEQAVTAQWYYTTDEVRILSIPVVLTEPVATAAFLLRMPPGRVLPVGDYRVELEVGEQVVKSLPFTVR